MNKKADPRGEQPPETRTAATGSHCAERGNPRKAGSIYAAKGPPRFEDVKELLKTAQLIRFVISVP